MAEINMPTHNKHGKELTEKQIEANKKNLTCRHFNSENTKEYQKLSVESRKRNNLAKKSMQETVKVIMSLALKKGDIDSIDDVLDLAEAEGRNISVQDAMVIAQVKKAIECMDTSAFVALRDTAGEKPKEQIEVGGLTMESYVKEHKPKF